MNSVETLPAEDMAKASERLNGILGGEPHYHGKPVSQINRETAEAMGIRTRAPRKDKGTKRPEKPKPADEIVLRVSADEARHLTYACAATERLHLGGKLQDQIIAQLQKQIDKLSAK